MRKVQREKYMQCYYFCILLLNICASCAPTVQRSNVSTSRSPFFDISTTYDEFKKLTQYTGTNCATAPNDYVIIRAWSDDQTGLAQYQIYVADVLNNGSIAEWRYYSAAYDDSGQQLSLIQIRRDVGPCGRFGCSLTEHVGLNVSRQYLTAHQESGIRFQLSGTSGNEVFFIPPLYVRIFLTHVQDPARPKAASSPSSSSSPPAPHPMIRTKVSTEAELDAEYEAACQADTIKAYQDFLYDRKAHEKHYTEALQRLDQLLHPGGVVDTGSLPQPLR